MLIQQTFIGKELLVTATTMSIYQGCVVCAGGRFGAWSGSLNKHIDLGITSLVVNMKVGLLGARNKTNDTNLVTLKIDGSCWGVDR